MSRQLEPTDALRQVRFGVALPHEDQGPVVRAAMRVKLQAFCRALEDSLGRPVIARCYSSYADLLAAVESNDADFAWLPPLVALESVVRQQAVPVVVPFRGHDVWYHSALFTRPQSRFTSVESLASARAAWVDPSSMAGYLVMRAWLRSKGIDCATVLSSEVFVGSHSGVVRAVLDGDADVGAVYVHLNTEQHVESAAWGGETVRILGVAGPIPADIVAVGTRVDELDAVAMRVAFTGAMSTEFRAAALALFQADRFAKADLSYREPLLRLYELMGNP